MDWYFKALKNYADFQGKATRSEYWYFALFNLLALIVLAGLGAVVHFLMFLYFIYAIAVLIPGLAVSVRRLHDIGKSGFWLFIGLVPIIGGLILLYFMVQPSK